MTYMNNIPKTTRLAVEKRLASLGSPIKAEQATRFFKTGKGQYGEGDRFFGVTVPETRSLLKEFPVLSLEEILEIFTSPWHEARLFAAIALVRLYAKSKDENVRRRIVDVYVTLPGLNNWDLVDVSAHKIVGDWLLLQNRRYEANALAHREPLFLRRIGIIATYAFIKAGHLDEIYEIALDVHNDKRDLTHKAVGWMLREAGKRDMPRLKSFLEKHGTQLPRTTVRYAIEKFPLHERQRLLHITRS